MSHVKTVLQPGLTDLPTVKGDDGDPGATGLPGTPATPENLLLIDFQFNIQLASPYYQTPINKTYLIEKGDIWVADGATNNVYTFDSTYIAGEITNFLVDNTKQFNAFLTTKDIVIAGTPMQFGWNDDYAIIMIQHEPGINGLIRWKLVDNTGEVYRWTDLLIPALLPISFKAGIMIIGETT